MPARGTGIPEAARLVKITDFILHSQVTEVYAFWGRRQERYRVAMADPKHLAKLKEKPGTRWRQQNPEIRPDLREAYLQRTSVLRTSKRWTSAERQHRSSEKKKAGLVSSRASITSLWGTGRWVAVAGVENGGF